MDVAILEKLGLKPVDWIEVLSPNQSMRNGVYPVSMTLVLGPNKLAIPTLPVIGSDLKGQPIKGLIGRDILANCVFIYNGVGGHYTLAIG